MSRSVVNAVKQGHREGLEAMRDSLAAAMDEASPAVVAQIAGRLQAVLSELASLAPPEVSRLDELEKRRAERESGADAPAPARRSARRQSGG